MATNSTSWLLRFIVESSKLGKSNRLKYLTKRRWVYLYLVKNNTINCVEFYSKANAILVSA